MPDLSTGRFNGGRDLALCSLAQLSRGGDWQLDLLHGRPHHLFVWITRGQGLALIEGVRRGLGTHNALYIPAGTLMAIEMGRQSLGHCLVVPEGTELRLPEHAHHLRIREVSAQSELSALFDAMQREKTDARPLYNEALDAHTQLLSVWLRRQLALDEHFPDRPNAAARLSQAYCQRIATHYHHGAPMADYARALGVTPTHLTRACRASTGKTAADLLMQRVLHEARSLLISGKVPVQDIARHLGFGSAAYFTRFIQHHTGQTPTTLRKAGPKTQPNRPKGRA